MTISTRPNDSEEMLVLGREIGNRHWLMTTDSDAESCEPRDGAGAGTVSVAWGGEGARSYSITMAMSDFESLTKKLKGLIP